MFYCLSYHLEHLGLLDAAHLYYVYIPRINRALEAFFHSYGTPHQLFVHGYLTLQRSSLVTLDFTEQIDSSYGIDEEGLISEESHLKVRPTRDYEHLCQQVNPLASSENYGIEVY